MSPTDWNWRLATDLQDYPWDCSATSFAWCTRTIGFTLSEQEVIAGLGPSRISPTLGLLDASGAGLVDYAAELGIAADNDESTSWDEVMAAAGEQPMLMGGRAWGHWVAVRMGTLTAEVQGLDLLALMNPAPGYKNVGQTIDPSQFAALGPFSAVWFTSW